MSGPTREVSPPSKSDRRTKSRKLLKRFEETSDEEHLKACLNLVVEAMAEGETDQAVEIAEELSEVWGVIIHLEYDVTVYDKADLETSKHLH